MTKFREIKPAISTAKKEIIQNIAYQTEDGALVKSAENKIVGQLIDGNGTITKDAINNAIDQNMPVGYVYVSGKAKKDEILTTGDISNSKVTSPIMVTVKTNKPAAAPTELGNATVNSALSNAGLTGLTNTPKAQK